MATEHGLALIERLSYENTKLRMIVGALCAIKWNSADRDNMEFTSRITYSQMDEIIAAREFITTLNSPNEGEAK